MSAETSATDDPNAIITSALAELAETSPSQTDGIWLEELTAKVAVHIRDWNVDGCWRWQDWPHRDEVMPEGTLEVDVYGIDLVARRKDDGGWIAIQCKARQLDDDGKGASVGLKEIEKFISGSSNRDVWAERWLLVNGDVESAGNSKSKIEASGFPVAFVNLAHDVERQHAVYLAQQTEPEVVQGIQTRPCMQNEAVDTAVARLLANKDAHEEGIPRGEARGRIVLPCGTGKTRIALRIVERLTYPKEFSVVLCPSIALVAQIRREFLNNTQSLRALAVCSDHGVAKDEKTEEKITNQDDATLDRGMTTTDEIHGCQVTTDPAEISAWLETSTNGDTLNVIFGTYQSARRIADAIALASAHNQFAVLICDEAHRTAGIRKKKLSNTADQKMRDFTLCHDREAFPATYRVYQTATPKIYGDNAAAARATQKPEFVIRDMDDQATFGVELYRRSYADAVANGWLSDYRIIAMAVGGEEAMSIANDLVAQADEQAELDAQIAGTTVGANVVSKLPTTGDYLKGMAFALAMGGAARTADGSRVPLQSCIGFLNTIARSKAMTSVLQSTAVRDWVSEQSGEQARRYKLEHLDASSQVTKRDEAKRKLANASTDAPHSILNVGIFGEGTDSPSLSAVAFLEPRKSPIDVVQAVGRAMRRVEGKELGYIVVPVVIPPGVDAERHLAVSDKHEGWRELGDILQALRAHDKRIEDALPEMLRIQLPPDPQISLPLKTVIAVGRPEKPHLEYAVVTGSRDDAEDIARDAARQDKPLREVITERQDVEPFTEVLWSEMEEQPTSVIVHTIRTDGSKETREDSVVRHKPKANQDPNDAKVNVRGTQRRAGQIAIGKRGRVLPTSEERVQKAKGRARLKKEKQDKFNTAVQTQLIELQKTLLGKEISMNLLEKSGLHRNPVKRDLNLLRGAVEEASRYLHAEFALAAALDAHFDIDKLAAPRANKPRADGSTVAALLWMNAAMLQQRVYAGGWLGLDGIDPLSEIKASSEPEELFRDSWGTITRQDFLPVIEPATLALSAAKRTTRLGGLRRALRHLAGEAERIAEVYAEMGTDHAGALFNKVMGDQSSDGAFFTRPVAADIAARLAMQAVDPNNALDWTNPEVWQAHKTVDLACGSGTLLTAVMAEMKRRALSQGVDTRELGALQKVAVEESMVGLDINPVSLQLAATQLMSGNADIKYRKMNLHLMPYGPQKDGSVAAGTPELFGRKAITNALTLFEDGAKSTRIELGALAGGLEGPVMDDATDAVKDAKIVIMNPPFTNRTKMGEKFGKAVQTKLRQRMDTLEGFLVSADKPLSDILEKNSLGPQFAALGDLCLNRDCGVFATVIPTAALTASSGLQERLELAKRFHVHTILTCHDPSDINLSQNTNINESIVILQRTGTNAPPPPPTRIISLDRLPGDTADTDALFASLTALGEEPGILADGWGEVSYSPAEQIRAGDYSAAVWRSPELATAAAAFGDHPALATLAGGGGGQLFSGPSRHSMRSIEDHERTNRDSRDRQGTSRRISKKERDVTVHATGQELRGANYRKETSNSVEPFPILKSKGSEGQLRIEAVPDEIWEWKKPGKPPILKKAAHLLLTQGQDTSTARLTAVASDNRYVGNGWVPVTGLDPTQSKAAAVFCNSTPGRLLLMRNLGKKLGFPFYSADALSALSVPNLDDGPRPLDLLAACWEATRNEIVPQFRDGYETVRRLWDQAVCKALGWDIARISELGKLLAEEPHVKGVARGQWKP